MFSSWNTSVYFKSCTVNDFKNICSVYCWVISASRIVDCSWCNKNRLSSSSTLEESWNCRNTSIDFKFSGTVNCSYLSTTINRVCCSWISMSGWPTIKSTSKSKTGQKNVTLFSSSRKVMSRWCGHSHNATYVIINGVSDINWSCTTIITCERYTRNNNLIIERQSMCSWCSDCC